MRRVFVTQEVPKFDLSPAQKYGQIIILLPLTQVAGDPTYHTERLAEKLADFSVMDDHLLLLGDPVLISIATAIVSIRTQGRYQLLKWDKFAKNYQSIPIAIPWEGEYKGGVIQAIKPIAYKLGEGNQAIADRIRDNHFY